MSFTAVQRKRFAVLLTAKGWRRRGETLFAPSGGLWFDDSHLMHWSPKEMSEVFTQRAARIEKAAIGDWKRSVTENLDAALAAKELMSDEGKIA